MIYLLSTGDLRLSGTDMAEADSGVLADPLKALTTLFKIARGVGVAMHVGIVILLYLTAVRLARDRWAALAAAGLFASCPGAVLFSRMTNVDLPMVFWFAGSLLAYFALLDRPTGRRLMLFFLLAVLAVCTKEQIAFVLLPMTVHGGLVALIRAPRGFASLVKSGLAAAVLYGLLQCAFWAPGDWLAHLTERKDSLETFVSAHSGTAERFSDLLGIWGDALLRYPYVAGPGGALLLIIALVGLIRRPVRGGLLLLAMLVLYVGVTFWITGFAQFRYMIPGVLLGALITGLALAGWTRRVRSKPARAWMTALVLAALAGNLGHSLLVDRVLVKDVRGEVAAWLEKNLPQGAAIEHYANSNYLPPLKHLGFVAKRCRNLTLEGFRARRPEAVLVTDGYDWAENPAGLAYLDALGKGPEGYRKVRFGPKGEGASTVYLAPETRDRIWPNITVLVRRDVALPEKGISSKKGDS